MAEKDEVTGLALRVEIDSYEDILGVGGKNSILNYAGLKELINNPPSYSEEEKHPQGFVDRIIRASVEILGQSGTTAIVIRAGRSTIKHIVTNSKDIKQLADNREISKTDKLKAVLGYYAANINRPPLFDIHEDRAVFHNPGCTLCDGIRAEKAYCTYVCGVFEGLARFIAGFENARCEEVVCKATVGDECRYEILFAAADSAGGRRAGAGTHGRRLIPQRSARFSFFHNGPIAGRPGPAPLPCTMLFLPGTGEKCKNI